MFFRPQIATLVSDSHQLLVVLVGDGDGGGGVEPHCCLESRSHQKLSGAFHFVFVWNASKLHDMDDTKSVSLLLCTFLVAVALGKSLTSLRFGGVI